MKAKISEIFTSFQGEGPYTGVEQIFVRFYGCNLHCEFCDTRLDYFNLYSTGEIIREIDDLYKAQHSISLTGGEPLLQADFLQELLPLLKERDFLTYLETNGTLHSEFTEIKDLVDILAMDIKLPSSCNCGSYWDEHRKFLEAALDSNADLFIKTVITGHSKEADLKMAAELAAEFNKDVPFILQPDSNSSELGERIKKFKSLTEEILSDVRVMRQEHKHLGVK